MSCLKMVWRLNPRFRVTMGLVVVVGLLAPVALVRGQQGSTTLPNPVSFPDPTGVIQTYSQTGSIDMTGPFFQSLGTNGRSCSTCHRPAEGWAISADEVASRFELTQGTDPIFHTNDGSVCDQYIDTSTVDARRQAFRLLIGRGLLRIALPVPSNAEFSVVSVVNPYGCNDPSTLSTYRRPLPAANLRFLTSVMWDGRESSTQTGTRPITWATNPGDLLADLAQQAVDATNGHAQAATPPTMAQLQAIVNFEAGLSTAQVSDSQAGALDSDGAKGGASMLAQQTTQDFFVGVNDPLGRNPHGSLFSPAVFNLFDAWTNWNRDGSAADLANRRASIARGEALFNTRPINITGVAGLNDELNVASIQGTCGTCHNTFDAGNHSQSVPLNIGVSDVDSPLDVSYLPVITLQNNATGEIKETTDPARALVTGLWKDIGKVKGPTLRGLAARAPYFHNGSAKTLDDVVTFYDMRFHLGLTPQEKSDLAAFLSAL